MRRLLPLLAVSVLLPAISARAIAQALAVNDPDSALARTGAPVSCRVTLNGRQQRAAAEGRLGVREAGKGPIVPAQFEAEGGSKTSGRIWWRLAPGAGASRTFTLAIAPKAAPAAVTAARDETSGQIEVRTGAGPVLRYNYKTIEPGPIVDQVAPTDRIYARARSDYIHPLYGPGGEEMTKDLPIDHPHHRGIYWAWPEVVYGGDMGDLHALQKVFARPTGTVVTRSGPVYAEVEAENLWRWEDKEPIVRERAIIRSFAPAKDGRWIDLIFRFESLGKEVSIARRHTDLYGGLNIRMATVKGQQILFHTDPAGAQPRQAWADLSGTFAGASAPAGLTVLQSRTNPDYPGDWVKYPELNWFQPTFPAPKTRYDLKPGQVLTLRFRLWVHAGASLPESAFADQWNAYDLAEQP